MGEFQSAVKRFEKANPWLGDAHGIALVTLRKVAAQLDSGDLTPALLQQLGLTYRDLMKRAPESEGDVDPVEDIINRGRGA